MSTTSASTLTYRHTLTILSGLMLGMLLSGLDQTVVATAGRTIGDDLGGLADLAWLTTAFLITSTITTLLYGKLSDVFGRKRLYMLAIVLFLVGSALCGLATSMPMLIVFRAFQGLGAGGLMSLAFAITGDIIPGRERARYQGYFAATMALSSILGPIVGGLFAGLPTALGITGWRWIFWINLPLGVAALIVIAKTLHVDQVFRRPRIDYLGAVLLAVAVIPALLVGEQGSRWGWLSVGSIACYVIAAVGAAAFIAQQFRMKTDALLPLGLFRRRAFTVPVGLAALLGILQLGGIAVLPIYLQIVHGATPTQSGLLMLPMVLGISAASVLAGRYTSKTGKYKILPIVGMILLVIAFLGLASVDSTSSFVIVDIWMLLIGLGIGASMNTVMLATQNAVEPSQMGVATASGTFFRNLGGAAGTAVLLSVLFQKAQSTITSNYANATSNSAFTTAATAHPGQLGILHEGLKNGLSDTSFLGKLNEALTRPFLDGFSQAMDLVSLIAASVAVGGVILALLIKEQPLRAKSGNDARTTKETAPAPDSV